MSFPPKELERRGAPWCWSGLLVLSLAGSASATDKRIGLVGGGLWNNLPALAGTTIVHEPVSLQPPNDRSFGGVGGLILEFDLGDFGALRFEPRYMRKGADLTVILKDSGDRLSGPVALDYVSIPVMLKSTIYRKHRVNIVLLSGIGADFLVSGKYQGEDVKDDFESFDLSISARVGVQAKVGEHGLLGAHFMIASSLLGIDRGQPNQAKLKNNGYGFAVEYTTALGK